MIKVLLLALTFLAVSSAQNDAVEPLQCYFCESIETPQCEKNPNEVTQVYCKDLIYDRSERSFAQGSASSNGKNQHPLFANVFKRESARALNVDDVEYKCMKVDIVESGQRNFIRSCAPLVKNVNNACDFFREQVDTNVVVKSCEECDSRNCNSAFSISSSLLLHFATALLVWFIIKL